MWGYVIIGAIVVGLIAILVIIGMKNYRKSGNVLVTRKTPGVLEMILQSGGILRSNSGSTELRFDNYNEAQGKVNVSTHKFDLKDGWKLESSYGAMDYAVELEGQAMNLTKPGLKIMILRKNLPGSGQLVFELSVAAKEKITLAHPVGFYSIPGRR